jgi:hypothetical protein
MFKEELISMIMKPKMNEQNHFKKSTFLDLDVGIDDDE